MNAETSQNPNTANSENPFTKMAEEMGAFDKNKQFLNGWYGFTEKKLESISESPIDVDELMQTKVEDSLDSREEWERQIVDPYVFGIHASTAEIGKLVNQFAKDEGGVGIDKSIRGSIELFSKIYGLEQKINIEPLPDTEEMADTWGLYVPGSNTFWFNFKKVSKEYGDDAEALASQVISTAAHELWHARQDEASKKAGTLRNVLYETNFREYKSPEESYHGYRGQLIEEEAHIMGTAVRDALKAFFRFEDAFTSDEEFCKKSQEQTLQMLRTHEAKLAEHNI